MKLSENLKRLRKERNLTQTQLSKQTELSQPTISKIEKGRISNVNPLAMIKLAESLGVTLDYLVGRTESMSIEDRLLTDPDTIGLFTSYSKMPMISQREILNYARYLTNEKPPENVH